MSEDGQITRDQPPLLGVVLCCTSIPPEQRSQLADVALQMGATHKLDLTSDVTHLIVGNIDTPKYKYVAKERQDIQVLKPEWLEAVRASWIQGGDTDVAALEKQYRLPPLFDLHICVTGFDDLAQRTEIQEAVAANGATYHGDLTKSVTHLIASHPSGRKYEYAGIWRIKIVSIEWLHQSLDRGMTLDEGLFHPLMPLEERGQGAVTAAKAPSPVLGKRARPPGQPLDAAEIGKRKLRRSASNRLGSQSGNLWEDLSPVNQPQAQAPIPKPERPSERGADEHNQIDALEGNKDGDLTADDPDMHEAHQTHESTSMLGDARPRIFVYGFDEARMKVLRESLENSAQVLSEEDLEARSGESSIIVVVPHSSEISASSELHGTAAFEDLVSRGIARESDEVVTEFWVEQCLWSRHKNQRFTYPTDAPLCAPFKSYPISGFEQLTICPTSFSGMDLLHFSKAAKLVGAKYDEYLRKHTSVLVCRDASANAGKLRYALENSIPVVSAHWFFDCVKTGTLLSFDDYELSTSRQSQKQSQPCFFHPITNPRVNTSSEPSFRSNVSRPSAHRRAQQGRLDLAPSFPADKPISKEQRRNQSFSGAFNESFNTANESVEVLKDVSLSKQNSQQRRERSGSAALVEKPSQKSQSLARSKLSAVTAGSFHDALDEESLGNESVDVVIDPEQSLLSKADSKEHEVSLKPRQDDNLHSALAAVLARRKPASGRPQTESSLADGPIESVSRRHRKLGRAASNGSHALSRANSLDSRERKGHDPSERASEGVGENDMFDPELETTAKTRFGSRFDAGDNVMFRPSQALSYEDPDALAMKEQLMRRVNGETGAASSELHETGDSKTKGERVQSIGVVKNSSTVDDGKRRGGRRK